MIDILARRLNSLDRGFEAKWQWSDQKPVTINASAFCLAFIGDMPQQNAFAGIESPGAKFSCRFCLADTQARANLTFDTLSHARTWLGTHHQILRQRQLPRFIVNISQKLHVRHWTSDCMGESYQNGFLKQTGLRSSKSPVLISQPVSQAKSLTPSLVVSGLCHRVNYSWMRCWLKGLQAHLAGAVFSTHSFGYSLPFTRGWARLNWQTVVVNDSISYSMRSRAQDCLY